MLAGGTGLTNSSPEGCHQLLMPQGEGVDPFGFQWNV